MNEELELDFHEKLLSILAWLFMSLAALVGIVFNLILNPNKEDTQE